MNKKSIKFSERGNFIRACLEFFAANGKELIPKNGEPLPLDKVRSKDGWSIDVWVLLSSGIYPAYYRKEDKKFTVRGVGFCDAYTEDVKIIINKFITTEQLHAFKCKPEILSMFGTIEECEEDAKKLIPKILSKIKGKLFLTDDDDNYGFTINKVTGMTFKDNDFIINTRSVHAEFYGKDWSYYNGGYKVWGDTFDSCALADLIGPRYLRRIRNEDVIPHIRKYLIDNEKELDANIENKVIAFLDL